jgi:RND family efflux transporter MFP subunit
MKKAAWLGGGAAIVLAAIAYMATRAPDAPDDSPAPSATVSVLTLMPRDVPLRITAWGSIVAGPAETNIALAAPGIVTPLAQPGQAVAAGQALAQVAPDPQSAADLRKAQDAVRAARAQHDHVAALLQQHLATTADLAAATQAQNDAIATLAALRAAGLGEDETLRAPFAGIVAALAAAPGGMLPAGTVVFKLADGAGLTALVGVPEAAAQRVQPEDPASLTLLNTNAQMPATVVQRAAMIDPQTGLIDITLRPLGVAPLGEPVAVTITVGTVTGYPVPRAAVLSDEQGSYVYQLDGHDVAHREPVRVLEAEGGSVVLAPTLDPGMRLATAGAYELSDGMTATLAGAGN